MKISTIFIILTILFLSIFYADLYLDYDKWTLLWFSSAIFFYVMWLYFRNRELRDNSDFIKWIEKRIQKTEMEREREDHLQKKINKGVKLTVYKEVLNYIKNH